jgi:PleD family two-component response regulator
MENDLKHVSSLIVDDQDFIRMLIRRILKDIGCRRIKEASNVNDA